MVQRSENFGFAFEAGESLGVLRESRGQNLDRHFAIERRVSGPVHLAHAARTNGRNDFVGAEFAAPRQWHMRDSA